jgi:integrase
MGLHLRGKIWQADFYADGKRIQESTGTANKREAEKHLALRISEVQRGVFVKETRTTLDELWERYLPHAEMHKRSWKRDVQMFGNLKAFFGSPRLRDITAERIEKFQQFRSREVAPATVNRETALLKHLFFQAEKWGLHTGSNPVRLVRFLAEDNLKCETLSPDEEAALLLAAPPYLKDMVTFAVNTGLRRSDVFNLRWEDVDIEKASATIIVKKNRKPHTVFLNPDALAVIKRQRTDTKYVFTNPMTGEQIKSVRGGLAAAVKRAGLKKITFHMFRHTVATRLLQNGADIVTVKEIMGHSNINTTLRYAHTNAERQRREMEKLASNTPNDNRRDESVTVIPQRKVG